MRSAEDLRPVLATVLSHIAAADQKAATLLTIAGVLVAFPAPTILVPSTPSSVPLFSTFCAAVSACAFVASICGALVVLFPRTKNKTNTSSLIYFGDIAATSQTDYAESLNRADDGLIRDDLIAQIHITAQIARTKHGHFKFAVISLITGIVFLGACYVGIAFATKNRPASAGTHAQQTKSP
jgi:hypothetical protein